MAYEHLKFSRETPLHDRHKRPDRRPRFVPPDPRAFGSGLRQSFEAAKRLTEEDMGGYDGRTLFKVQLRDDATVPDLWRIPGIELVSQEDKTVVLAFATQDGLAQFESRLSSLARNGTATRAEILYALQGFDHWTVEDRMGAALRLHGFPTTQTFIVDIELWPLDRADQRNVMLAAFIASLREHGIEKLDDLNQPSLVMVRVRCTRGQAEALLLRHRDVRMVDLPPRAGVSVEVLLTDINRISEPVQPADDAPAITVLDSGLASAHPLLAASVGDAQGYLAPARQPHDNPPHQGNRMNAVVVNRRNMRLRSYGYRGGVHRALIYVFFCLFGATHGDGRQAAHSGRVGRDQRSEAGEEG